ncbi:hypothetical protein HKT18_07025 [Flavobacterium sp. IMCC34852]|uniref:Uncharacterized protein n=1 Tax=Flavobacterium rivulicola TaxID=2732161 RepID=A0A7Y3R8Q9_9FLAO|nr:hypothetical protein [Flavobacterium sp. IMCC34852]NNT71964.1 hypothetical protein [Flavobacterium sp. IMCC34852]
MRTAFATFLLTLSISSCGVFESLNSNTAIKPKEKFVLGNNKHGVFKTHLKNEGITVLKIYQAPIDGGSYSPIMLQPQETATVKTAKNTALIIENTGEEYASVTLKVRGDLNLGMSYNNQ